SNVLVSDGLINAGVIFTKYLDTFDVRESGGEVFVTAGAGLPVKKILAFALEKEIGGLAFLTGIPGSVGGALFGNAGAGGESFAPFVERIETVSDSGEVRLWDKSELQWQYRSSPWKQAPLIITKAEFRFTHDTKENIIKNIRHFAELKKGQPLGAKTAGCVFKNPPGNSAGKLLDECGCKSLSVGGARVSPRHANFVENTGCADSEDIYRLTELCRKRVFEEFGIRLEYEIKFFGTF
ncbi:MAG: UDP-N-acetylmuramate dehydrogenase, partial [Synergistes sp.]|nr:UDP-N-acetylmuramate dehydrogenase [Synergistes sp.]